MDPRHVFYLSALYVLLLLFLGYMGRRAKKGDTLSDHFLAGRSIGLGVLLLTLFATQYSGNSLSGFPGKTYRSGLSYVMCVTFMTGIVAGYVLFAPRLFRVARERLFITPSDFLAHRFESRTLHVISVCIFLFVLVNFLLAQLMAIGHAFGGLVEDGDVRRQVYMTAVVGGAAVILIYELMGGMRAVAWTDALQGTIVMLGLLLCAGLLMHEIGSPLAVIERIRETTPEKVAPPDFQGCLRWWSTFVLLGFGAPLYPQAIQRIYAAHSGRGLRRALAMMAFLPLVATTTVVFVGLVGITTHPGLEGPQADKVIFLVLDRLVELKPLIYVPLLIVMMGVLSAIMSTADSCLLSITSIVTKDVVARRRGLSGAEADSFTRWAPRVSIVVMLLLVPIALLEKITLWKLLEMKFEALIQLSPAFVLGCWHERAHPRAFQAVDVVRGLLVGVIPLCLVVGADFLLALERLEPTGLRTLGGIHFGVLALVANYAVVFISRELRLRGASTTIAGTAGADSLATDGPERSD